MPSCLHQAAWIVNASVRGNITFGKEYDQARYDEVVEACSLAHDFKARHQQVKRSGACRLNHTLIPRLMCSLALQPLLTVVAWHPWKMVFAPCSLMQFHALLCCLLSR